MCRGCCLLLHILALSAYFLLFYDHFLSFIRCYCFLFLFLLHYSNGLRILSLAVEEASGGRFVDCNFHFVYLTFCLTFSFGCLRIYKYIRVHVCLWTLLVRQYNHNGPFNPIMQAVCSKGRIVWAQNHWDFHKKTLHGCIAYCRVEVLLSVFLYIPEGSGQSTNCLAASHIRVL